MAKGQGRVYRRLAPEDHSATCLRNDDCKCESAPQNKTKVWWMDYSIRGKRHRESTETTNKNEAFALLRDRIGKRTDGTLSGRPEKVTLADLKAALARNYLLEGKDSWARALQAFAHLEKYFGSDARAIDITRSTVADYQTRRLERDEAAQNTVRYETGVLSAAFNVAFKDGLLPPRPLLFTQVEQGAARAGFFESADFAALVTVLPVEIGELARFARMTGWRRGECTGLTWSQVDWDDAKFPGEHSEPVPGPRASIRIGEAQTKGNDAREFPIAAAPELRELLLARWRQRSGVLVFHRRQIRGKAAKVEGQPIGDFRKEWDKACKAAGVPGRLFHDLRRTAARDFRRAGVSEGVIMRLCGWKTRDMFDRYNIIDASDLSGAVAARFNGTNQAQTEQDKEPARS